MQPLSRDQILRGFNRNEERARAAVYELYQETLLALINKITRGSPDAPDLMNDTFVILYKHAVSFDYLGDIRDFLLQTGKNICINYLVQNERNQKKLINLQEQFVYSNENFDADIIYSETRALLFKSVEKLPDKLKTVFRLRYFEDMENEAVAKQLNIAIKTAYNRYSDARKKLKWDLERIQRFTVYLLNLLL